MRKVVRTFNAPRPGGVYSQAVVAGHLIFVAGQACVNPETNQLEFGDIQSETRRTLQHTRVILEAAGSSLKNVLRVGVFFADMNDFAAMNEVYEEFFRKIRLRGPLWQCSWTRSSRDRLHRTDHHQLKRQSSNWGAQSQRSERKSGSDVRPQVGTLLPSKEVG